LTIEARNSALDEEYCSKNAEVRPGQYVEIAVTDTGTGMTNEVASRAFEPFFTTKEAGRGTGLGLSQVYGFIKQSGGHVKIYTETGQGTTVKVYLPCAQTPARDDQDKLVRAPSAYGKETILVVEDDGDLRAFVSNTLQELSYVVLEASDSESALKLVDTGHHIDLLLTDVILPNLNGRELANAVLAKRAGTKVLFMTGYSRNAILHQSRLDPGVQLIQKPFTRSGLAKRVRDVLDMND
jgi:CheY-like chemotaxis protein